MTATDSTTTTVQETGPSLADQMCERIVGAAMGMADVLAVYLGDRLGLYRALADGGPATPGELAATAGIDARYAREWLEHHASAGIVEVARGSDDPAARKYRLPEAYRPVFLEPDDLVNVVPVVRALVAIARPIDRLLEAFRSGEGVPYAAFGTEIIEAQEGMNRPLFVHLLASEWLPAVADVDARLRAEPPARVADIACGTAHSSIAIARGYPRVTVDGYDLDPDAVAGARRNIGEAGLEERVRVYEADVATLGSRAESERYDLVTILDALHDLPRPVEVLAGVRAMLAEAGSVIVMEPNVGDEFQAPAGEHFLEPFFYAAGMMLCLPASLATSGSAGTGAVMRLATLEGYAADAGFTRVERLPIEHVFYRFYRLRP